MKAVVLEAVRGQPGLADHDVLLGGVEDVGHPGAAQVVQVAHRLAVTDDDARADLGRHTIFGTKRKLEYSRIDCCTKIITLFLN